MPIEDRAASAEVMGALAQLKPVDRDLILLVAWDELTPSEAGQVLGLRPVTARSRLHRARQRLSALLQESDGVGFRSRRRHRHQTRSHRRRTAMRAERADPRRSRHPQGRCGPSARSRGRSLTGWPARPGDRRASALGLAPDVLPALAPGAGRARGGGCRGWVWRLLALSPRLCWCSPGPFRVRTAAAPSRRPPP